LLAATFSLGYAATISSVGSNITTCGNLKEEYKANMCCGNPSKEVALQIIPGPKIRLDGPFNPCHGQKPGWANILCAQQGVTMAVEQAGGDVTVGYRGSLASNVTPVTAAFFSTHKCPVNVHWHLGAEHRSAGQFDETGSGNPAAGTPANTNPNAGGTRRLESEEPEEDATEAVARELAGYNPNVRYGYACKLYNANDARFTTDYTWQHCVGMHVGATYEVHWPHSGLGACETPNQYQTPFYDGVFCGYDGSALPQSAVAANVGVQSQVFTIINDEDYYYPTLMRGMIVDGQYGKNITAYTGSTTGTSRSNNMCSSYGPITWQVDRQCHLISASTFDKMCADMKQMRDDMSGDLYAHGARELVASAYVANNQVWDASTR
jgi:hypothetical protein